MSFVKGREVFIEAAVTKAIPANGIHMPASLTRTAFEAAWVNISPNSSVLRICSLDGTFPLSINTHTHTHTYIYIYSKFRKIFDREILIRT